MTITSRLGGPGTRFGGATGVAHALVGHAEGVDRVDDEIGEIERVDGWRERVHFGVAARARRAVRRRRRNLDRARRRTRTARRVVVVVVAAFRKRVREDDAARRARAVDGAANRGGEKKTVRPHGRDVARHGDGRPEPRRRSRPGARASRPGARTARPRSCETAAFPLNLCTRRVGKPPNDARASSRVARRASASSRDVPRDAPRARGVARIGARARSARGRVGVWRTVGRCAFAAFVGDPRARRDAARGRRASAMRDVTAM